MNPVTVVAVGDTPSGVIAELAKRTGTLRIVRRCPELAELLAACQNGLAQAAVVAGGADELSATLVDRLAAVGVSVVAIAATETEAQRLRGLGAVPVSEQATPELLSQVVVSAVQSRRWLDAAGYAVPTVPDGRVASGGNFRQDPYDDVSPTAASSGGSEQGAAPDGTSGPTAGVDGQSDDIQDRPPRSRPELAAAGAPASLWARTRQRFHHQAKAAEGQKPAAKAARAAREPSQAKSPAPITDKDALPGSSTLVAVWGPIGSPGRTTVAINLAAEQAATGMSVMVIDADSYGASIAAALGLLEESASFAQACRAADQGSLSAAQFAAITTKVVFSGGSFSLLTGLTRADRWPELRAAAVARVLQRARESAQLVVVDCGFSLENDEELSYDTIAPRRNAATLAVLAEADIIYAVGSGDPVGIPRLIRGMNELQEAFPVTRVEVVVNKVRRKAAGRAPEKALAQAWERFGPSLPIRHFLPWDPDLCDRALLEGRLLLEIAPDAPLRKAIREIDCAAVQQKPQVAVASATAEL
ncbi:chromosome partitioning protein [Specibacter sp. NPDC078692]|uniref:AAA family ATPase n=1 Tax=Specibacter sp. NPDC078692 TaxID=3155818 RepID=UPI003426C1EE